MLAERGNRNAVYLLKQAAEKTIRAVLTSEGIHGGIGHDLKALVDRIPDENPAKGSLRAVEHLGAYATTFRYPTAEGRIKSPPSEKELAADLTAVEAALSEIASRLGVDFGRPNAPATKPGPIR